MKSALGTILALALAIASSGCGTWRGEKIYFVDPRDVRQGDPRAASFGVKSGFGYDQIWNAALKAMGNGMTILESHKPSGVIKSREGSAATGKVVAFFIRPTAPNAPQYTIETISVRPIGLNSVGGTGWDPKVVEDFNAALNAK
jgi:hypothetical protein